MVVFLWMLSCMVVKATTVCRPHLLERSYSTVFTSAIGNWDCPRNVILALLQKLQRQPDERDTFALICKPAGMFLSWQRVWL